MFSKVGDYTRIFCEKKKLPPDTLLKIYEACIFNYYVNQKYVQIYDFLTYYIIGNQTRYDCKDKS